MRNWKKSNSNRGGALLSVIIAMAVVGILGAIVLSVSYTNFRMKQIDKKSTDNFYSAEGVVDQICAGLQEEVSIQYKKAYTTVMENYGNYDDSAEMSEAFNVEFVLNMVGALQDSVGDAEHYKLTKIQSYVEDNVNYPVGSYTVTSESYSTTVDGSEVTVYENVLDTLEDGLCIRNLVVSYKDGAYVNTITTDIKISTPQVEFARISSMPEIADYSFIAQDGIQTIANSYWDLEGKAFAGTVIDMAAGSSFDASNTSTTLLVTEGDVNVAGAANFKTGSTTSLYANAISANPTTGKVAGNTISLDGRTYIKDDTTLNGQGNTLKIAGQYYGYSNNDADASGSSAIIVNGTNSTLDMSELKTLVLAGTSFVATKIEEDDTTVSSDLKAMNTSDVLMGDSIAVKGNQLAYMLPTECEGIETNPMTYEQYAALSSKTGWQETALGNTLPSINRSLASYGNISIQPVMTARDGGTVYLYLSFSDANVASRYFMDYYGSSEGSTRMNEYLNRYITTFRFNSTSMNRLIAQGNYLVPAEIDAATGVPKYTGNTGNVATTAQELANYSNSYEALCAKLVENKSSLTSDELGKTVYENLIATAQIERFFAAFSESTKSDNVTYTTPNGMKIATIWPTAADVDSTTAVRCIVVDNAGGSAYEVPAGGSGIIIATGDVYADAASAVAWDGLIICNGKLTLDGGSSSNHAKMHANVNTTSKVMQLTCTVGQEVTGTGEEQETVPRAFAVLNFFIGGGDFSIGSSSSEEGANVDVRDCLSFENWKSE